MIDYRKCKRAANQLLLAQDQLPLDLNLHHLNHDKKIIISSMIDYCRIAHVNRGKMGRGNPRGITIYDKDNDIYIILYGNHIKDYRSVRWLIAHELGHIYLGHYNTHTDNEEPEANYFARQLLIPAISLFKILYEYNIRNTRAIASMFNVPESSVRYHIETIKKMKGIPVDESDYRIWEMQMDFVARRIEYAETFYDLA